MRDLASPFNDLTPDSQFYKKTTWLQSQQITTGFDDGGYHPFESVHRQATAAFLYRMTGYPAVCGPGAKPQSPRK